MAGRRADRERLASTMRTQVGDHRRRPGRPAAVPPARAARASTRSSWRAASRDVRRGAASGPASSRHGTVDLLARGRPRRPAATARASSTAASTCSGPASGTTSTSAALAAAAVWVYGQTEVVEGPDRGRGRGRRGRCTSRSPTRRCTTSTPTGRASASPTPTGAAQRRRVRRRRRLRRLPRRQPADGPGRRCRPSASATYPYAWLGILADVAPSTDELIYAWHPDGFALHSMRSPTVSRLYLQVDPTSRLEDWPDDRIWDELGTRLALRTAGRCTTGRSPTRASRRCAASCSTPMRHGRLFLAGDAAHIVPPTGAKGLNLAVADVALLGDGARAAAAPAAGRPGSTRTPDDRAAPGLARAPTSPGG